MYFEVSHLFVLCVPPLLCKESVKKARVAVKTTNRNSTRDSFVLQTRTTAFIRYIYPACVLHRTLNTSIFCRRPVSFDCELLLQSLCRYDEEVVFCSLSVPLPLSIPLTVCARVFMCVCEGTNRFPFSVFLLVCNPQSRRVGRTKVTGYSTTTTSFWSCNS